MSCTCTPWIVRLLCATLVATTCSARADAAPPAITQAQLEGWLARMQPLVEVFAGEPFTQPIRIQVVDLDTQARTIENGLRAMRASDAKDAGLNAAISVLALQRSRAPRAAFDSTSRTIQISPTSLMSMTESLRDETMLEPIVSLMIVHALASAADVLPAHALMNIRTLDALNATESLREGWALLVQKTIAEQQGWSAAHAALTRAVSGEGRNDPAGAAVRRQHELHAATGMRYLNHARVRGGWPSVRAALAQPPTFYAAVQKPGEVVAAAADVNVLFAGIADSFGNDDEREWQRLSRRLSGEDLKRTYGSLGRESLNEILGMSHHAYMFLQMAPGARGSVTHAVTVFHLKDPSSSARLRGYLDALFDRQSAIFDQLNDEPGMEIRRAVDVGTTVAGEWTARRVTVRSEREGAVGSQELMRQTVLERGPYLVQYQGITEPLGRDASLSLVTGVMERLRTGRESGGNAAPDRVSAEGVIGAAVAGASEVFDRSLWTVGRTRMTREAIEPMIGEDTRASAAVTVHFMDGVRMICDARADGLLGRRKMEVVVVELKDATSAGVVASAMSQTFMERTRRLSERPGISIDVAEPRVRALDGGGRQTTIDVDLGELGVSSFRTATFGMYVINVVVADGDPAASGMVDADALIERVVVELRGG